MKKAFTMAELLIVIAIIGVVAALIMPIVRNTTPNKNEYLFRKAYSSINQAVYETANNSYLYPADYRNKPVLAQPMSIDSASTETLSSLKNVLNITATDTKLAKENYFCYAIRSLMTLKSDSTASTKNCNCSDVNAENFETADGTKFYGLCDEFSENIDDKENFEKAIYVKVRAAELDEKYKYTSTSVSNIYKLQNENSWYVYRIYVNANGQILLKDDVERKIITENKNM